MIAKFNLYATFLQWIHTHLSKMNHLKYFLLCFFEIIENRIFIINWKIYLSMTMKMNQWKCSFVTISDKNNNVEFLHGLPSVKTSTLIMNYQTDTKNMISMIWRPKLIDRND